MATVRLPDGVSRERALTVLKWLAKGKDTRLTAELSDETRATVDAILDLCPDPSPAGIRAIVADLERVGEPRPEPIRGPVPPLTPAAPRVIENVDLHSIAVTMHGNGYEVLGPAFAETAVLPTDVDPAGWEPPREIMEQAIDQVDQLVERVQALRPPDPDPAAADRPDVLTSTCAVCASPVTYRRGHAGQALTEHYTARHPGGRP